MINGGKTEINKLLIKNIRVVRINKEERGLGILNLSKKATIGSRALIIIKATKREKTSALIIHKSWRRIRKKTVKIIVLAEISIL